ncbi:hypothetical protein KFZ76_19870 [Methylovulum psychrotolerans]|uniref:hypothetical protein n=1 Tax=Methylovulum psychrotolerans TaxID=1704499 RepID=UPI001BFF444B|nr:hypothetical protein [Methylovulum psychrotolerans]MBT9099961.1 hypothetical protein [Methylovulum psychrotolerans]
MTDMDIEAEYWTRHYENNPDDYANPFFDSAVALESVDLSEFEDIINEHYQYKSG